MFNNSENKITFLKLLRITNEYIYNKLISKKRARDADDNNQKEQIMNELLLTNADINTAKKQNTIKILCFIFF